MRDTLLVVTGAPGDRQAAERLRDHDLECVAVSPDAPARVFCGTFDAGLWRSIDGGDTWKRLDAGFESDAVMAATVSPHDPEEVWVGTEPSAVYRSADGGTTWEAVPGLTDLPSAGEWSFPPRPHTHHVRWIEVDPHDPDRLYVGVEAGALVVSDDRGQTWRERPPGARVDNHQLATHPRDRGRVYAAAGDGYAESHDGGDTWEHPQDGLDHRYVWSVAPDPGDPDTVLVSAASGARRAHSAGSADSYVYRRRDGGPWERVTGLPTGDGIIRAVLAPGREPGTVYAANNRGLYRSVDAGDSWEPIDVSWPERFREATVRGLAVV